MSESEDLTRTVCFCYGVRYQDLLEAIQGGAVTLDLIQADTQASLGCGGCESEVIHILKAHRPT